MAEDQTGDASAEARFHNIDRAIRYAHGDEHAYQAGGVVTRGMMDAARQAAKREYANRGEIDERFYGQQIGTRVDQVPFPPVLNEVACLEKGLSSLSEAIELLEQRLGEVLRSDTDKPGVPDDPALSASPLADKLARANCMLAVHIGRLHLLRNRLTV